MGALTRKWEPVPTVGLPLYRCLGVCGHIATGEAEMAAHDEESHDEPEDQR